MVNHHGANKMQECGYDVSKIMALTKTEGLGGTRKRQELAV